MEKAILENRRTGEARNMRMTRYGKRAKKSGREDLVLTEKWEGPNGESKAGKEENGRSE